jgi:hypothetical protein
VCVCVYVCFLSFFFCFGGYVVGGAVLVLLQCVLLESERSCDGLCGSLP